MTEHRYGRVFFKTQTNAWVCKIDGRQYTLAKGRESYTQAVDAYSKLLTRMKAGTDDGINDNLQKPLSYFVGFYVAGKLHKRQEASRLKVTRWIDQLDTWTQRKAIGAVSGQDIEDWLDSHPRWGCSTRKKVLDELSSFYGWLVKKRYIRSNIILDLDRPREAVRGEEMVIDAATYQRLHDASPAWLQRIISCAWSCGARPGEILASCAEDYSPRIRALCPLQWKCSWKGLKRQILLPPHIAEYVEGRINSGVAGPLWPSSQGKKLTSTRLNKWLGHYAKKAGLTAHITGYTFRHSFAVRALEMGLSETVVAGLLGHSGTATLHKHYAHTLARVGHLQSALDRLSAG